MADPLNAMHELLWSLENGTKMTIFSRTKKPESRMFLIKLETRELICIRNIGGKPELKVDLRLVHEIREGKNSKDFEKCNEDTLKYKKNLCFVILYGTTFKLKTLSLAATDITEYERWIQGLQHLVGDTINASHPLQVERWLRKEFYNMEKHGKIGLRDLKSWLVLVDFKITSKRLQEMYQDIRPDMKEMNFEEFAVFYRNLMFIPEIFRNHFSLHSDNQDRVTLKHFQKFLLDDQQEPIGNDETKMKTLMTEFNESPSSEFYFSRESFLNYLFSKENSIWNGLYDEVNQDMDKPLSNYWIASSHNTYLMGDQFLSDSSTEAYARVLRTGCRCIELDCWDGPDEYPHIYHGHTLTSRIRFLDVLKTIRENAFIASDFPLILSIENHCSLPQQKNMALGFRDVLGDMLLTYPMSKTNLPSPNQLKKKIIIKHKKLREDGGGSFRDFKHNDEGSTKDLDLSSSVKNGIMFIEDPFDKKWNPHFFVVTPGAIYYTKETNTEDEEKESDKIAASEPKELTDEDRHLLEPWYHGNINRTAAQKLFSENLDLGDGAFLIRKSEGFPGEFSLSFLHRRKTNHCRIQCREDDGGRKRYFLTEKLFDNLCALVAYHRQTGLKSRDFTQVLTQPLPVKPAHVDKPWFYPKLSRDDAEDKLSCIPEDGAFLIRQRTPVAHDLDASQFAISFRAERKIKHCKIRQDGLIFTIGNAVFESLAELVEYYQKYPLYRRMKLRYAVSEELLDGRVPVDDTLIYTSTIDYVSPNSYIPRPKLRVRALSDYRAQQNDELSFYKHAIITDVQKEDGDWWRGNFGDKKNCWFPVKLVEELETEEDLHPLGSLQKGTIDLTKRGIAIEIGKPQPERPFILRIAYLDLDQPSKEFAVSTEDELKEWRNTLNDCINNASKITKDRTLSESLHKIAKELSDLVVYCNPVSLDVEKALVNKVCHTEMFSLPETRVEKLCYPESCMNLLNLAQKYIFRIYPKGGRIDSSNYDPVPMWNSGCQLVALNYQTPDRSMQLNEGLFSMNGKSGFVLKPRCVFNPSFSPYDRSSLLDVDPMTISLKIIAARHMVKLGRGMACCLVEVEIVGCSYDNNKFKTSTTVENGLNPVWDEPCEFDVVNPAMAQIRFLLQDEDMFGDNNLLGQATYPLLCLKTGFRSVQLRNEYSENIELASLLVHLTIRNPKEDGNSDIYSTIQLQRDKRDELQKKMENYMVVGNEAEAEQIQRQIANTQNILSENELRYRTSQGKPR